jgi:hypothetical protein
MTRVRNDQLEEGGDGLREGSDQILKGRGWNNGEVTLLWKGGNRLRSVRKVTSFCGWREAMG